MSPWKPKFWAGEDFPKTKQPPPEHGIKAGKSAESWWSKRWIVALEHVLGGDSGRLARGRTYARGGRTHDFSIEGGKVSAKVTGSRPKPYRVTIAVTPLSDAQWQRVVNDMASKAQFAAELLAGRLPQSLPDVFREANAPLFPEQRADLRTSCTCPDDGDPCKHVAAAHYVLGEALDRDPFLLLELRGRKRDALLEALRIARGGSTEPKPKRAKRVPLPNANDYDAPRALPKLELSFDVPASGALLRQLGSPAHWQRKASPADELLPLIRSAAERARLLALSEPDATEPGAIAPGAPPTAGDAPTEPSEPVTPLPPARRRRTRS